MKHTFLFLFLFSAAPLFFYKLGQTSLVSWDEAWYAEIARNIMKSGNLINMTWNNGPYFDHPPAGFWLMALTYKLFGVNELWTRFPSAAAGMTGIFLLYLLGRKLFNPLIGLLSAIALSSAVWFVFRARSGNLDTTLTMFFLLTLLLALKAAENKKYLFMLAFSLSLLFLTKTMAPFAIIPSLILIYYKSKIRFKDLILPAFLFSVLTAGWFISQIIQFPNFLQNYLGIGLRGTELQSSYIANLLLTKDYLHSGIGRWFWPSILSLILSIFLRQKRFLILILFFITFTMPVFFSPKIQIWHLIPLFPVLILIYFGFTFVFLEKYLPAFKYKLFAVIVIFSAYIYISQIKMIWYQFIDIPAFISDEAILSKEAGNRPQKLIIDGEYRPSALFYSEKGRIEQAPKKDEDLANLIKSKEEYLLITNKWRLEKINLPDNYQIIKEDRDKMLILHK